MKKFFLAISFFSLISFNALADTSSMFNNLSDKVSEFIANIIPGEGVTEVDVEIKETEEPTFQILAVRPIGEVSNDGTNFVQFSLTNRDIGDDERYVFNIGAGHRFLEENDSIMLGVNAFYDHDLNHNHQRGSLGVEARASLIDFNANYYMDFSDKHAVNGTDEQALGGADYKLISQIPHLPWANFSFRGYKLFADKGSSDLEGNEYSLSMLLTPSMKFEFGVDENDVEDQDFASITFTYPPNEDGVSLIDGFMSVDMFQKKNMEKKLLSKVERNNKIFIELQGAVIITKK